jgi:hypothetical protein
MVWMYIQGKVDIGVEVAVREWFEDIPEGLCIPGTLEQLIIAGGGQKDNRVLEELEDKPGCRDAVHDTGKVDVHEEQVGFPFCSPQDRFLTGCDLPEDTLPLLPGHHGDEVGNNPVVFHDQDAGQRRHTSPDNNRVL